MRSPTGGISCELVMLTDKRRCCWRQLKWVRRCLSRSLRQPRPRQSQYVWDLYATYLMRDASQDVPGWNFWTGVVASSGRENVRRAFEECSEFAALIASLTLNGAVSGNQISLITSRVDPRAQPGNGLLTRDATWTVPLVSLPGRAGLDLGLSLSYSSQVWTRSGPFIYFDEDSGFPSPGFRLGFPTIQRKSFDAQTATNTYLLITPSGHRVELRQVGTSNIYEAADSSYLQLTDNGTSWLVHSPDGTQLTFGGSERRVSLHPGQESQWQFHFRETTTAGVISPRLPTHLAE